MQDFPVTRAACILLDAPEVSAASPATRVCTAVPLHVLTTIVFFFFFFFRLTPHKRVAVNTSSMSARRVAQQEGTPPAGHLQ